MPVVAALESHPPLFETWHTKVYLSFSPVMLDPGEAVGITAHMLGKTQRLVSAQSVGTALVSPAGDGLLLPVL